MSVAVTARAIVTVRWMITRFTGSSIRSRKLFRLKSWTTAEVTGFRYQNALSSRIASEPR
jgi:hypothetical protein